MGRAYKNFWSLNTDEAVVAGILREYFKKNIEVFLPLNAQLKDVDLILVNLLKNNLIKIQVKGSRAYEPSKKELITNVDGSAGWFYLKKDSIYKNIAEYFIFLVYVIEENKNGRKVINPHTLTIPTKDLIYLCEKNKKPDNGDKYSFFFWVNPKEKTSFEFRNEKYDTTKYLDDNGFRKMIKDI